MNRSDERPSLRTMASDNIKKYCENDYKRFYGLRTDIRELIQVMLEIHHEMKLQKNGGAV